MADSITKDAKKRAEKLVRDAEIKSEKIVGSCKHTVDAQRFEYNRLRREINDFRERLIVTYKNHLERIKDLPAFEDESDYPATMEDAVRMAEEREEVSAEFVPESPTEPVASVTEPESVPEMKAESEPQTPETSAKKPFTRVKVEEEEIPAVPVTDTVEFKRQKIEPQKKPISRGTVDEEIPSTGRFSSDEIYFGPDYDLEEEEKKPKNKRRSIFGKRREDEETSD